MILFPRRSKNTGIYDSAEKIGGAFHKNNFGYEARIQKRRHQSHGRTHPDIRIQNPNSCKNLRMFIGEGANEPLHEINRYVMPIAHTCTIKDPDPMRILLRFIHVKPEITKLFGRIDEFLCTASPSIPESSIISLGKFNKTVRARIYGALWTRHWLYLVSRFYMVLGATP